MGFWPALALDAICILVFATVGRSNHGEVSNLFGVLRTAWPFLAGALLGVLTGRTWRSPASLPAGVHVWVAAVVAGMILRVLTGGTTQVSFILVTAVVLGVLVLGWRAGLRTIRAAQDRRSKPA